MGIKKPRADTQSAASARIGREMAVRWLVGEWLRVLHAAGRPARDARRVVSSALCALGLPAPQVEALIGGIVYVGELPPAGRRGPKRTGARLHQRVRAEYHKQVRLPAAGAAARRAEGAKSTRYIREIAGVLGIDLKRRGASAKVQRALELRGNAPDRSTIYRALKKKTTAD